MIIKTVQRGRRTIYQLRHSISKRIITAADSNYLNSLVNNSPAYLKRADPNLHILLNYYMKKRDQSASETRN